MTIDFSSACSAISAVNEKTKPILIRFKVPGSKFTVEKNSCLRGLVAHLKKQTQSACSAISAVNEKQCLKRLKNAQKLSKIQKNCQNQCQSV